MPAARSPWSSTGNRSGDAARSPQPAGARGCAEGQRTQCLAAELGAGWRGLNRPDIDAGAELADERRAERLLRLIRVGRGRAVGDGVVAGDVDAAAAVAEDAVDVLAIGAAAGRTTLLEFALGV